MKDTPARLLALLSLLQSPRAWPGSELAGRLGVSPRTVRRDVDRLRELGYPVEATKGAAGGYRMAAGAAMPPLLLDDEEAVAIAVGLRTAAGSPVAGIEDASVRALAKLEQVLPARLRRRVAALGTATVPLAEPPGSSGGVRFDPEVLTVIAGAVAGRERVRFWYRAADGTAERGRLAEPCRLVAAGRRWYLLAWDNDREDWRIFRVDRIRRPFATGVRVPPRDPPGADAAAYVRGRLYALAPTYRVRATLGLPADEAARLLGAAASDITPAGPAHCLLEGHADTVEWLAARLLMLGCQVEVHEPAELRAYLRTLGTRALRAAGP
ncbi:helix-turn-helix transcriptional regulator [Streptomyces johnsoniae]|uniref:YafY family protein n=1 Tax=Streptomyces johnsoniae TaxID=3075532 RepID=A0ABU2RZT0_9ACTN|nr:YafY family protein [Streptomyces sp. DSM 41886]MDT0442269.1 YafY family protein [Streptomyces sp. DSM 41886]